jgi:hypothetical protein
VVYFKPADFQLSPDGTRLMCPNEVETDRRHRNDKDTAAQVRQEHPKGERKLAEMVRYHGGWRVRYRGRLLNPPHFSDFLGTLIWRKPGSSLGQIWPKTDRIFPLWGSRGLTQLHQFSPSGGVRGGRRAISGTAFIKFLDFLGFWS